MKPFKKAICYLLRYSKMKIIIVLMSKLILMDKKTNHFISKTYYPYTLKIYLNFSSIELHLKMKKQKKHILIFILN